MKKGGENQKKMHRKRRLIMSEESNEKLALKCNLENSPWRREMKMKASQQPAIIGQLCWHHQHRAPIEETVMWRSEES